MRRRDFVTLVGVGVASLPVAVRAQQAAMKHIGVLMDVAETDAAAKRWVDAFETSLAALGWRKGRDCDITYHWGASNPELLERYAEELARLAPDVILVHGTPAMIPLQKAHTTIPIVDEVNRTIEANASGVDKCSPQKGSELGLGHLAGCHDKLSMLDGAESAHVAIDRNVVRGIGEHKSRLVRADQSRAVVGIPRVAA